MRAIGLLTIILLAIGCAGTAPPSIGGDDTNDPPPKVKEPPSPKDGAATAPGCDGVPERGVCRDGVAVKCDINEGEGEQRRTDCRALGKNCIEDQDRGAVCEAVAGNGPDSGTGCGTVTFEGECDGNTAIWCENNTTIKRWECGNTTDEGGAPLSCAIITEDDELFELFGFTGSFCVSDAPVNPPPTSSNCPAFGFAGKCTGPDTSGDGVGDTVVWCSGADNMTESTVVCGTGAYEGRQCEERPGNSWCYTPPAAPPNECELIGIQGVCQDDDTVKYCANGQILFDECGVSGQTCKQEGDPGACFSGAGAYCCPN